MCLAASITFDLAGAGAARGARGASRPNILLILADDLGWSDLGCYGGEIRTPHLDALAAVGVRFTQFYNSARCCPSRASLLTGLYPHQAGVGHMTADRGARFPGYRGALNERCVTLAEVLRAAGYSTALCGKWHVGDRIAPTARGLDEFYGFQRGYGVDSWDGRMMIRLPADRPRREYAEGAFFATDAITDHALDFLRMFREQDRPWFLYLAYQTPHFPLHTRAGDARGYADLYSAGWDQVREARLVRQRRLGLVPDTASLSPRGPIPERGVAARIGSMTAEGLNPAWDSLAADRRADLARRMAAYAGMVSGMDRNIGRVVAALRSSGELDDTLILFLSDNGACAEWEPFGFDLDPGAGPGAAPPSPGAGINSGTLSAPNVLHRGGALEGMGGPGSGFSYGSGWANACNAPLRSYKHACHEGGIRTPLIVHWPARIGARGALCAFPAHIIDMMPTLADVAGARYPAAFDGRDILPAEGVSLVPAFDGTRVERRGALFFEHEGNRAVRSGRWKLVAPAPGTRWELYDVEVDPIESVDRAGEFPGRVAELAALWDAWAHRACVLPKPGPVRKPPIGASPGRGSGGTSGPGFRATGPR